MQVTPTTRNNADEIISDEVQEIMNHRLHWSIRNGNLIFLMILMIFLAFTWFIKYPDIIKGPMKLSAVNAPKLLVAKTEGKLQRLLVVNEQNVVADQPLAFLQSTADHGQVIALKTWISLIESSIIKDSLQILLIKPLPLLYQLGEIQSDYQMFQDILKETVQILDNGYFLKEKHALIKDLEYLAGIKSNAEKQEQLLKQDYELQQEEYKANEALAMDKVIAPLELNQNKSKVLNKQQSLQQIGVQIIGSNMNSHNKEKEILDLQKYVADEQQRFRSELFNLKSKVEMWLQKYVIVAPEDGKVLFTSFLQEKQLLSSGQELFYVQPRQTSYYGQLMVSQRGFGKIKLGQRVLVRVQSYPSTEFGYLTGSIGYISNMPSARDSFLIKVDLPKDLQTNYDKTIFFRNNLMADAEIMTDNRKLFDRFIGQLKDIL